jgi:hypothetical protein
MFEPGDVVRFNYLWSREAAKGEESGRKSRPSCVIVRTQSSYFILPITSQRPPRDGVAIEIPEMECKRARLSPPCWIILDEYNRVGREQLHDFESLEPQGRLGRAFVIRIATVLKATAEEARLKSVQRS